MAAYICWLAHDYKNIRGRAPDEVARIRAMATQSVAGHKRTPTTVAHLMRGWLYFLKSAVSYGALDEGEAKEFIGSIWKVLGEVATRQASHQETQEPAQRFIELLSAAIASGRAHLANTDGEYPENPQALGWRPDGAAWKAQGVRVGWIDDKGVFIEPDAAYSIASSMVEALPVTQQTLWKRLRERGLLASVDEKRETLKVRRRLEGRNHSVLHLNASLLLEGLPTAINPDKPDTVLRDDSSSTDDVGSLWNLLSVESTTIDDKTDAQSHEEQSIATPMSGLSGHLHEAEAKT